MPRRVVSPSFLSGCFIPLSLAEDMSSAEDVVSLKAEGRGGLGSAGQQLLLLLSRSVVSDSARPQRRQPTRLLRPWDFPGKSTGVGCHCLLRQDNKGDDK